MVGSNRYISPYGRLLLHHPSYSFSKDEQCYPHSLEDLAERLQTEATKNMAFITAHANARLLPNLLKRKLDLGQNWLLDAKEAIHYGLVDSVKTIDF
jgi:ATP-dependent protease ClpP protease subunit